MVRCDGCGEERDWLMLVCGQYLCQQCVDKICKERNELEKKVAELERMVGPGKFRLKNVKST